MNKYKKYKHDVSEIISTEVKVSEWKLIRKLYLPEKLNDPTSQEVRKGIVIDVEATGLNIGHDDVIQLAMLPFE